MSYITAFSVTSGNTSNSPIREYTNPMIRLRKLPSQTLFLKRTFQLIFIFFSSFLSVIHRGGRAAPVHRQGPEGPAGITHGTIASEGMILYPGIFQRCSLLEIRILLILTMLVALQEGIAQQGLYPQSDGLRLPAGMPRILNRRSTTLWSLLVSDEKLSWLAKNAPA